jgi:hypothetical protein
LRILLFPQVSQAFFDCLYLEFELAEIGFQFSDLLLFCLVATVELIAASAAFAAAVALATIPIAMTGFSVVHH